MNVLQAGILGIVEGITEFLPISSTGHLMLTVQYLRLSQTDFIKSFEIAIQFGAILAVVVLYWKTLISGWDIWKKVIAAFLPTAIIGLLLYKVMKKYLLASSSIVLWALFLGGILLIIFELFHREKDNSIASLSEISYSKALLIGLFQTIAIIPGVSRSAATIVGGLALGLKRKTIVEFSFLLAVPTMCAAMVFDLTKNIHAFTGANLLALGVGFIVSFIVALLAIRFLLVFIKKHTFIPFGIYRILAAIAFWFGVR
jgi:undecaprenyl-diphosphatase